MPAKKRPARAPSATAQGRFELRLEDIRGQNAATLEAVISVRERLDEVDGALRAELSRLADRVQMVEMAVRQNSSDILALRRAVDDLSAKLDTKADRSELLALERRVAALERRQGS